MKRSSNSRGAGVELPRTIVLNNGINAVIRDVVESDAAEICRKLPASHIESDFLAFMPGEFQWTIEQEKKYIRDRDSNPRTSLICATVDGHLVALAGAQQEEFRRAAHRAEIGITVFKEYWNIGLGRALTDHLIKWAATVGLRKLTLRVFADNARAIALYRSLGFYEEGLLKEDVLRVDGTYSDTIMMGLMLSK